MPGYRRPHTAPSTGSDVQTFDALEKTFSSTQWVRVDADWFARGRALEERKRAVPTAYVDLSSSDGDSSGSRTGSGDMDEEVQEQSLQQVVTPPLKELAVGTPRLRRVTSTPKLRRTINRVVTPPHLTRLSTGLPPTPPTMANSEDAEPRAEGLGSNPQFADAVRNALHTQRSASNARGQQLPSPDLTPPAISEARPASPASPASPSRRLSLLQPLRALRLRPSSRTDSYHTARETQTPGASQVRLLPLTPSSEPRSSNEWLSFLSEDPYATSTGSGSPRVGYTPMLSHRPSHLSHISEISGLSSDTPTPKPLRPRRRAQSQSTYRPRTPDEDELERHVSYIGDQPSEDQAFSDTLDSPIHSDSENEEHISYISDHSLDDGSGTEHVNNLVYKHIQEENVKRHSATINDNAMPVGIWFPDPDLKEHRLRRTTKAESLRNVSGTSEVNSQQDSVEGSSHMRLRHKKASLPSRSLSLETSPIVGSSPFARTQIPRSDEVPEPTTPTQSVIDKETMDRLNFDSPALLDFRKTEQHTLPPSPVRTLRLPRRLEQPVLPTLRHSSAPMMAPLRNFRQWADLEQPVNKPLPTRQQSPPRVIQHKLRHFPNEAKLENNPSVHRTSIDAGSSFITRPSLEAGGSFITRPSIEVPAAISGLALSLPSRSRSFDTKLLRPTHTPHISASQLSTWSEAEVCEAQGVKIYPHTNHSLLVVQHGSSPLSVHSKSPTPPPQANYLGPLIFELGLGQSLYDTGLQASHPPLAKEVCQRLFALQQPSPPLAKEPNQPRFASVLEEPSPVLERDNPIIHLDTSITSSQTVSAPPVFEVIPPTPSEEVEQELDVPRDHPVTPAKQAPSPRLLPQKRISLRQKAKRFSESYIEQPLFGRSLSSRQQTHRPANDVDGRPTHLSPMWRPDYLWSGYESEEDPYLLNEYELSRPASARLPHGGDTSEIEAAERRQAEPLPRNLSVRMPGFRGEGGFHVGNSLGLDRHGSNNRRHHVVIKKNSVGGGFGYTGRRKIGYVGELRSRSSKEMIKRHAGLRLPWGRGRRLQFVGLSRVKRRIAAWRTERGRERRRLQWTGAGES